MQSGKRERGVVGANGFSGGLKALPVIRCVVNGKSCRALVDTGCSRSIVKRCLVGEESIQQQQEKVTLANGLRVPVGTCAVVFDVEDKKVTLNCTVMNRLPENLMFYWVLT